MIVTVIHVESIWRRNMASFLFVGLDIWFSFCKFKTTYNLHLKNKVFNYPLHMFSVICTFIYTKYQWPPKIQVLLKDAKVSVGSCKTGWGEKTGDLSIKNWLYSKTTKLWNFPRYTEYTVHIAVSLLTLHFTFKA